MEGGLSCIIPPFFFFTTGCITPYMVVLKNLGKFPILRHVLVAVGFLQRICQYSTCEEVTQQLPDRRQLLSRRWCGVLPDADHRLHPDSIASKAA